MGIFRFGWYCLIIGSTSFLPTGASPTNAQEPVSVLPCSDGAPDALGEEEEDRPKLTQYVVPAAQSTGVGELHIYATGGNGIGLAKKHSAADAWPAA